MRDSSETRVNTRGVRALRAAFLVGAIADAFALLPMLLPPLATSLWGIRDVSGSYRVAMGCAASLMFGWTLLLVWASRRPLERRDVAPLTFLVVAGIVLTEAIGAVAGIPDAWRLVPTWCMQGILLVLFGWAHYAGRQAVRVPQAMP